MSILRADSIRDRAGTGAPDFPNGLTGTLTGTATTATALSGTPNITVGTVGCGNVTSSGNISATDATFSGNLTVNGTTTTIDTAVTSVDSLAVDGNVGIGTTNALAKLHVNLATDRNVVFNIDGNGQSRISSFNDVANASQILGLNGLALNFQTSNTERLHITSAGTAIFKAGLAEKNVNGTTLAAASNNIALSSGNVHRFTGDESGAKTVNFTGVHATLANGESVSFTVILTPNNSGYINVATVDGATPGTATKWSGGSAPSSGSTGGRDVYTFTIFKYGTATTDYEVYGAVTNYS